MKSFKFQSPSLDIGCGDGMLSFIRAGGEFHTSYDAFQGTSNLDRFFENIDVYDSFNESIKPMVTKKPQYKIDYAFDHKENLLKKAELLGLYNTFKIGDANKPFPFPNNSFLTIFSNIIYWLDNPQSVLNEISRILKPGGQVCLMLPNKTFPDFSFFNSLYQNKNQEWAFLSKLDRGRLSDNIKHSKSAIEWEYMFANSKLQVEEHHQHLSKTVIQIWDIGMRPLFPMLMKMIQAMEASKIDAIKKEWVHTMKHFLQPIVEMDAQLNQDVEPAFHCYILTK